MKVLAFIFFLAALNSNDAGYLMLAFIFWIAAGSEKRK